MKDKLILNKFIKILFVFVFFSSTSFYKIPHKKILSNNKGYKTTINTNFLDYNFYKCIIDSYNIENNNNISYVENLSDEQLSVIKKLNCNGNLKPQEEKIKQTIGLEKLVSLETLNLEGNLLTSIDISNNKKIKSLNLANNKLSFLDLTDNLELEILLLFSNNISSLDLTKNVNLRVLELSNNSISEIDVSKNKLLSTFGISNNKLNKIDLTNNSLLTELHLYSNNLETVDLSRNNKLEVLLISNNSLRELDVSKNVLLKDLSLAKNSIKKLDVSNNKKIEKLIVYQNSLEQLDISNNVKLSRFEAYEVPFFDEITIYRKNSVAISNSVLKFPEGKSAVITNLNSNDLIIDNVQKNISSDSIGTFDLVVDYKHDIQTYNNHFSANYTVNVVEITSDKHIINNEKGYIYIVNDNDINTIIDNINVPENINIDIDLENNNLKVISQGQIIKEFDLVRTDSTKYDLTKEYIYVGNDNFDINAIETINMEKEVKDNSLVLKFENEVVKQYPIVGYNSDTYDLSKEYIYIGINSFDINNINVMNMTKEVKDNKLLLKYNDEVLAEYLIIGYSSDVYDLTKEYIYTGINSFDINNINVMNMTKEIKDNKLLLKYENILEEYSIINFNIKDFKVKNKNIFLYYKSTVTYDEFTSSITTIGVTYKIYNDNQEIIDGNLVEGMVLKIYFNDSLLDEYSLLNEYYKFSELLNVDETQKLIYKLKEGTTLAKLSSLIDTSGEIKIQNISSEYIRENDNVGTKYKLIIEFSKTRLEYTLSIAGDVTCDGIVNIADVLKIADHTITEDVLDEIEVLSAEVTKDSNLNIADVLKIADYTIDNSIEIWK